MYTVCHCLPFIVYVVPSFKSSVWYSGDGHVSHSHHHTLQPHTLHSTLLTARTTHPSQWTGGGGRDKPTTWFVVGSMLYMYVLATIFLPPTFQELSWVHVKGYCMHGPARWCVWKSDLQWLHTTDVIYHTASSSPIQVGYSVSRTLQYYLRTKPSMLPLLSGHVFPPFLLQQW